ncbi:hypothetical protein IG631_10665 [Alternaria alternata]|nr:hypothetical protein IG631_10665 [Alternaria alternata]
MHHCHFGNPDVDPRRLTDATFSDPIFAILDQSRCTRRYLVLNTCVVLSSQAVDSSKDSQDVAIDTYLTRTYSHLSATTMPCSVLSEADWKAKPSICQVGGFIPQCFELQPCVPA